MAESRKQAMRKFGILIALLPLVLSGCVPMSLFANGSGKDYAGYSNSLGHDGCLQQGQHHLPGRRRCAWRSWISRAISAKRS